MAEALNKHVTDAQIPDDISNIVQSLSSNSEPLTWSDFGDWLASESEIYDTEYVNPKATNLPKLWSSNVAVSETDPQFNARAEKATKGRLPTPWYTTKNGPDGNHRDAGLSHTYPRWMAQGYAGVYARLYRPFNVLTNMDRVGVMRPASSDSKFAQDLYNESFFHEGGHLAQHRWMQILNDIYGVGLTRKTDDDMMAAYNRGNPTDKQLAMKYTEYPSTLAASYEEYKRGPSAFEDSTYSQYLYPSADTVYDPGEFKELYTIPDLSSKFDIEKYDPSILSVNTYSGKSELDPLHYHNDSVDPGYFSLITETPFGYHINKEGVVENSPYRLAYATFDNPIYFRFRRNIGGGNVEGYRDMKKDPQRYWATHRKLQQELNPLYAFSKPSVYFKTTGEWHYDRVPNVQEILRGYLSDSSPSRKKYEKFIPYLRHDILADLQKLDAMRNHGLIYGQYLQELREKYSDILNAIPSSITQEMLDTQYLDSLTPGVDQSTDVRTIEQMEDTINRLLYGKRRRANDELYGGGAGIGTSLDWRYGLV